MRILRLACGVLALLNAVAGSSVAQSNNQCDQPGEKPDMIQADIPDIRRWGDAGGYIAYSLGNTSCNIGTCWLFFEGSEPNHPVLAQNLFRLRKGRLEQIGQSWIKNFGGALQESYCGACLAAPTGSYLGVSCSDTYNAVANGFQGWMMTRAGVNPHTGQDAGYAPGPPTTFTVMDRRLQVRTLDLDPSINPGARYFVELQAIGADDIVAGNSANNWARREVKPTPAGAVFNLVPISPTVVGGPPLSLWTGVDPYVHVTEGNLPGDGTIRIATKVTWLGGGSWSYEYAVYNVDSNAAPLALSIPIPAGVSLSAVSFHGVRYHSNDPQDSMNWARTVGATSVSWKANTLLLDPMTPNVLRWGTLYNFRFIANAGPGAHAVMLGFSMPPPPPFTQSLSIAALTPSLCDNDGVCGPGETCASCAADCAHQGGGVGCCGNGACEPGETDGTCVADCGTPLAVETACGDLVDGDRDGLIDCLDPDCCRDHVCDSFDGDGDGWATCDCNDSAADSWATPGEARDLTIAPNVFSGAVLHWDPPLDPGGSAILYDVIRSTDPHDFAAFGECVADPDPTSTSLSDSTLPSAGQALFYLVRARDACPSGAGPLGSSSSGEPHTAPACN